MGMLPRKVKLEKVKGGYRYEQHGVRNPNTFEIVKTKLAGQTWWEVNVVGADATAMFLTLDEVRIFLAAIQSPWHQLMPERYS